MTKTTYEPRKDTRAADFPKYSVETHSLVAMQASHMASIAGPLREIWLQMAHNHKLAVAEAEAKTSYEEHRGALAEILKAVETDGLKGPRDLDVALDAIEALFNTERYKVHSYLSRCLQTLYQNIKLSPDLLGVCTQIDHVLGGQRDENARLREAIKMAIDCLDDKDAIGARQTLSKALGE
jgi:hypothetical protein